MPSTRLNGYQHDAPSIIRGRSEIYAYDAETEPMSTHRASKYAYDGRVARSQIPKRENLNE